MITQMLCRG